MTIGKNLLAVKACILMFGIIFLIEESEVYGKRNALKVQRNFSYADYAKSTTKTTLESNPLVLEQPASSNDIATDQNFVATVTLKNHEAEGR